MPVAGLAQAVGLLIVLVGVLVVPGQSSAAALGWGAVAGLAGAIGLMVYFRALAIGAIAVREGLLVLTSVVTGLYPVGVVLLAWLFLRERLDRTQLAGVGLALTATALIAI